MHICHYLGPVHMTQSNVKVTAKKPISAKGKRKWEISSGNVKGHSVQKLEYTWSGACCCCCCFLLYTASAISICVLDCLKPGLEERLFEAGCTVPRSSTTALPCLQLEYSQHSELSNCWAWILNLLLPIMVLVSKGFVSWMMLFNAG